MTLDAIAHALPSVRHSAADIASQTGADEAFITDKVGIRQRFVLGPGESGIDLAERACRTLFEAQSLEPAAVDMLVYVTQNPDRRIPHNSAGLATRLELRTNLIAFDLSLACSGYVYGLSIVEAMLASLGLETAVLVTCDPYSRIMASEDKATNAVFGDAATATLLTRNGKGGRLGKIDFGTDGSGGDAISVAAGGAAHPHVALGIDGVQAHGRAALALTMKGRDVFNFVMTRVPPSIQACLDANGLTLGEIDYFALHQGSSYMLQTTAQRAGIPDDKLLTNIADYGNTVSSSIPLLLEPLLEGGGLKAKRVLISGFGAGLSWATTVLSF